MSIDLDILPTITEVPYWGDIKNQLQNLLNPVELDFLGKNPALVHLGSNLIVEENDKLLLNTTYYLSVVIPNTLSITVMPNKGNLEELEYLEDYAHNLDSKVIQTIAASWKKAGYYYEITTTGGRSEAEPKLFKALTTAIAYISAGYVIVMNDNIFDLGIGVYKPDDFQNAQPNF